MSQMWSFRRYETRVGMPSTRGKVVETYSHSQDLDLDEGGEYASGNCKSGVRTADGMDRRGIG
jgi:hypothetical protein